MLYLIGLGLGDCKDITVKGLEMVRKCTKVYLESYTSMLSPSSSKDKLEQFYGREIDLADRVMIESNADFILDDAEQNDICLLVVGDPFGATTHSDLFLRAKQKNVPIRIIHNASILNAVGCCGLNLYNFGETVSIPLWTDSWKPDSYFDKILRNLQLGLHTLCLLDIKMKEQTVENIIKKRAVFEPPRFMTAAEAARNLIEIANNRVEPGGISVLAEETLCVGLARIGWDDQKIVACSLSEMKQKDLGSPLHCLIIVGTLHPLESDMLSLWQ